MDRRAGRWVREGLLRMRELPLIYDRPATVEPQPSMPRWPTTPLDPVAAVLWRDPRRGKELDLPQRVGL